MYRYDERRCIMDDGCESGYTSIWYDIMIWYDDMSGNKERKE